MNASMHDLSAEGNSAAPRDRRKSRFVRDQDCSRPTNVTIGQGASGDVQRRTTYSNWRPRSKCRPNRATFTAKPRARLVRDCRIGGVAPRRARGRSQGGANRFVKGPTLLADKDPYNSVRPTRDGHRSAEPLVQRSGAQRQRGRREGSPERQPIIEQEPVKRRESSPDMAGRCRGDAAVEHRAEEPRRFRGAEPVGPRDVAARGKPHSNPARPRPRGRGRLAMASQHCREFVTVLNPGGRDPEQYFRSPGRGPIRRASAG